MVRSACDLEAPKDNMAFNYCCKDAYTAFLVCAEAPLYRHIALTPPEVHLCMRAPADGLGKDATSLHISPQLNFCYCAPQGRPPSLPRLTLDLQWVILVSCRGEAHAKLVSNSAEGLSLLHIVAT